jgi:predicted phage terminase large subunit-like protein
MSGMTQHDIDMLENWWIEKSRVNFLAYRKYIRAEKYLDGWFMTDLAQRFQQFYIDLRAGLRPILIIQTPSQHGKSWTVMDFVSWLVGVWPELKLIFASYSDILGVRCNLYLQRCLSNPKYRKIFPNVSACKTRGNAKKTSRHIELVDGDNKLTGGEFRNTTVGGSITGESLDVGLIDDAVKGREQANSQTWSKKIWEWFTDDFSTRFSEYAGLLIIATRWTTHDLIARIQDQYKGLDIPVQIINYQAIATDDEEHRAVGDPLFPRLKSLEFLDRKKSLMSPYSWESIYQGNPSVPGGMLFQDEWWGWWEALPQIKYKFITADTAQKTKTHNDWTVFQCWGYGDDDRIYLLDKLRGRFQAPELKTEAEIFYRKHDTKKATVNDPLLRGMYIEDKSSGTGLLQDFQRKRMKVIEVPRVNDKIFRSEDVTGFVRAGKVVLNKKINDIGNLTKEAREFPVGEFDDDIDALMTAVEVTFINSGKRAGMLFGKRKR